MGIDTKKLFQKACPDGQVRAIIHLDGDDATTTGYPTNNPRVRIKATNPASVIYTSGSTGKPKGVVVPQRAVIRLVCESDYLPITPQDRIAQLSNAVFDAATFEIWGTLFNGACLISFTKVTLSNPSKMADVIHAQKIDILFVTTVLLNQLSCNTPQIFSSMKAVVLVREDTPDEKRLIAYVVAQPGVTMEVAELRTQLKATLPDHMIPAIFVVMDKLPLTPHGKVDRKALPLAEIGNQQQYVVPRNAEEKLLVTVWQEVLAVEWVGVHDDFFVLGGHSLLAVQLIAHLYHHPQQLITMLVDTLTVVGKVGARTVSLTELIPSATDFGRALSPVRESRTALPAVSTGHAATCTAVVINLEGMLRLAGRNLTQECLGVLGMDAIAQNTLRLMLQMLPHLRAILLCDLYQKRDTLNRLRQELHEQFHFNGDLEIAVAAGKTATDKSY